MSLITEYRYYGETQEYKNVTDKYTAEEDVDFLKVHPDNRVYWCEDDVFVELDYGLHTGTITKDMPIKLKMLLLVGAI